MFALAYSLAANIGFFSPSITSIPGKYLEYIFHIAIDSPLVIPFLSPPPGNTITLSILSTILFFPEREDAPASL